jgi:hypothetical protein
MELKDFYFIIPTDDRQELPVTVAELEAWISPRTVPRWRTKWETIKSQLVEGGEMWVVCAAEHDWDCFMGAEWISHRRNRIEINQLVIVKN